MLSIDACLRDIEAVLMNTAVAAITEDDRIVNERLWISANATRLIVVVGCYFDRSHYGTDRQVGEGPGQEEGNTQREEGE